jgi:glycerol-3-phosphate cytidylyltransferase
MRTDAPDAPAAARTRTRSDRMRVVYTSGTFDLFHIGHLNIIRRSRALGDYLIVGVSTDELVASYKVRPPIVPYDDRAEIIRSLRFVHAVEKQERLFDYELMLSMGVNVMTIGSDWKDKRHPNLDHILDHTDIEVVFLPYTHRVSSTLIKEQIKNGWQVDRAHGE